MNHRTIELEEIINKSLEKKIVLPNFQRNFVWNAERQKKYITSIFLDLAAGSFLSLDGKKDDFNARKLCMDKPITPADECRYLLDGQQRCSTIVNTFSNVYKDNEGSNWLSIYDDTFYHLQNRFVIRIDSVFFGYEKLKFDKSIINYDDLGLFSDELESYKLIKKNLDKAFHPGFWPKKNNKLVSVPERNLEIIKYFSKKKELPLFYLSDSNSRNAYIKQIIKNIANQQYLDLQTLINKNNVLEYLGELDPNIKNNYSEAARDSLLLELRIQWQHDVFDFFEKLLERKLYEIFLQKNETSKAITIFETINQPGAPLTEYDLLVAKSSRVFSKKNLNQLLISLLSEKYTIPDSIGEILKDFDRSSKFNLVVFGVLDDKTPKSTIKNHFSKLLSIFKVDNLNKLTIDDLKRDKILSLTQDEIKEHYKKAITSIVRALTFLHYRCGIVDLKKISYDLMLIPIAVALSKDKNWDDAKCINKIEYWYWTSIFSGHYRNHQNKKSFDDIKILDDYINGTENLVKRYEKIFSAEDYCNLEILKSIDNNEKASTAVQNSIKQFVLSSQPFDLNITGNLNYRLNTWDIINNSEIDFDGEGDIQPLVIEDHHIVPLSDASTLKVSANTLRNKPHLLNSCLNRTYISKYSNRKISNYSPTTYFSETSNKGLVLHCLPMNFKSVYVKKNNETDDDYYKRILDDRFYKIKENLIKRLDVLQST